MSRFDVAVLRSTAQLESLASEWQALSESFATPLLDHDWFTCAAQALHDESDLRVVVVREQGRLAAVAPLAVDRSRHMVLLGSAVLHEPSGWLYGSEAARRHLMRALIRMGQVIVFDRVPAEAVPPEILQPSMRWPALTITREAAESFVVPTNIRWETYCASLSARTRKTLAEARSRAERERGPVRFTRIAPSPAEVGQTLSLLVDVEAGGWKAKQGTALSTRPELLRFFTLYAERAAARNRLRISVLRIGDTVAAVELGVEAYRRMWGLKVAYNEQFAAYAPALQLIHASIEEASSAGLCAYEFLGSAESWQERWRPERHGYQLTAIYPLSSQAMITALHDVTARVSRKIQRTAADQEVRA